MTAVGLANSTQVADVKARVDAAPYSVEAFADLASLTSSDVAIGRTISVEETQNKYAVVAQGTANAYPDYSGSGGLTFLPLPRGTVLASEFGVVADDTTDDTDAINRFFAYMIDNPGPCFIGGRMKVRLGEIALDNGHIEKAFPDIFTAGTDGTVLTAISNANAAFIEITNGTASSGVGEFWRSGSLGGIRFAPASGDTSVFPNMHGLVLSGVVGTKFGYMRGDDLGGDTIHVKRNLFGGNNPDPYNVSQCFFEGAEGNRNGGRAFMNDNYVGLAGCNIAQIRAIENKQGAFFGPGASNTIDAMSVGSCAGWAVGDQSDVAGGGSSRFKLQTAEFDDVQFGIDTSIASNWEFGTVRFVHRHNFGPLNNSQGYWPRIEILAGNQGRAVTSLKFDVISRIEAGGPKSAIGVFVDFDNAGGNLLDCMITRQIFDNAGHGYTASDLYENFNGNSGVSYYQVGRRIIDTLRSNLNWVFVRPAATATIKNNGLQNTANIVSFDTPIGGDVANFDTALFGYPAKGKGWNEIKGGLLLDVPPGTCVQLAVAINGQVVRVRPILAVGGGVEFFGFEAMLNLEPGAFIQMHADQNSGSDVPIVADYFGPDNNFFSVRAV